MLQLCSSLFFATSIMEISRPAMTLHFLIALIAIILMILAIRWQSVILSLIDGALWFTLALLIQSITVPVAVYNETSGLQFYDYTLSYPYLSPIFWGLGLIAFVYGIYQLIEIFTERKYGEVL